VATRSTDLRCACDHVLHIVCVAWAIYVGVVPLVCLVLDCANEIHSCQHCSFDCFTRKACLPPLFHAKERCHPAHREQ
jgi:hypothetical protein